MGARGGGVIAREGVGGGKQPQGHGRHTLVAAKMPTGSLSVVLHTSRVKHAQGHGTVGAAQGLPAVCVPRCSFRKLAAQYMDWSVWVFAFRNEIQGATAAWLVKMHAQLKTWAPDCQQQAKGVACNRPCLHSYPTCSNGPSCALAISRNTWSVDLSVGPHWSIRDACRCGRAAAAAAAPGLWGHMQPPHKPHSMPATSTPGVEGLRRSTQTHACMHSQATHIGSISLRCNVSPCGPHLFWR